MLTFVVAFFQLAFLLVFQGGETSSGPAILGMATILGFGLAFSLAAPRIPEPPAFHLGFVWPPSMAWTAALFLVFSVLLISEADNLFRRIFPLPEEFQDLEPPEGGVYQLSLMVVLIAVRPAAEEILFRGFLQPHFTRSWGAARGILFASALNALAFVLLNPWAFASIFTMSVVLGILRHSSQSILPSLLLHAVFGLVSVLASHAVFGIKGFDDMSAAHTPLAWLAPAILLSGIGFALCRAASEYAAPEPPDPGPRDDGY
jgi:membrane protease YdiL (CAAX protease family)